VCSLGGFIPGSTKTGLSMKYELLTWEECLANPGPVTSPESLRSLLTAENERVRTALLEAACLGLPGETVIKQIQTHLLGLGRLADRATKVTATDTRNLILELLQDLLTNLESSLESDWPWDMAIPAFRWGTVRDGCRSRATSLYKVLVDAGTDKRLVSLVRGMLDEFLAGDAPTYRISRKVQALFAGLSTFPKATRSTPGSYSPDPTDRVIDLLLDLDFYTYTIFRFEQDRTRDSLKRYPDLSDQLLFLTGLHGYIKNAGEQHGHLREAFAEWLEELIREKQRSIAARQGMAAEDKPIGKDKMILTTLTVKELGCFISLFLETGIFANEVVMQIAKFMAQFVGTKNKGAGSPDSLYSSIYNITPETHATVERKLQKMLDKNALLHKKAVEKRMQGKN
jgi:hypothetical protein